MKPTPTQPLIGSTEFAHLWREWQENLSAKQVLRHLMAYIQMPDDLSGQLEETQGLLTHFDTNLAPHASFWKQVVKLVQKAFPGQELSQSGRLQRQIHQFRYLISSQQAEYVRAHYKRDGMTDREALAAYLTWKPYTLFDQGRLHQKIALTKGQVCYPGANPSVNLKILLYNRVEFILDSQGNFLNELDAQVMTEAGVANGASFNYGTFKGHWYLDVEPIKRHDPSFRKRMTQGFRAPNKTKKHLVKGAPQDYERSFYNAEGLYSQEGQALSHLVARQAQAFRCLVWKSRWTGGQNLGMMEKKIGDYDDNTKS